MLHKSKAMWDPDILKAAEEVDAKFPRQEWTSTYPGHGGHPTGRYSVDYLCSRSDGDRIAAYVWAHRKRLGVRYVIWYGRIISETSDTPNRWVRYFNADDPNPSKSHKNHVHATHYTDAVYKPLTPQPPDEGDDDDMPTVDEFWAKDLTRGPLKHPASFYQTEAYQQAKSANLRTKALAEVTEKVLAKLVADDPAEAELAADLKAIRAQLADIDADEEVTAATPAEPQPPIGAEEEAAEPPT